MLNRLPAQILILLLVGILIGVVNNSFSANKIPWIQNYVAIDELGETVEMPVAVDPSYDSVFTFISTRKAYELFNSGDVIFVDARIPEEYAEGHIEGAVNVDFEADEDVYNQQLDYLMQIAGPEQPIVAYCSGTECDASLMLSRNLYYDIGYRNIYVYFGGWEQWQADSLPIESEMGLQ
jgi:rhodanese-related sulfurtransferase